MMRMIERSMCMLASLMLTILASAQGKPAQQYELPPAQFTLSFWKDTAYLTNNHKAALDDLGLNLAQENDKVAIIVGCALSSERNAILLSIIRAFSVREWVVGINGIKLSRVLLRSCNHLSPHAPRDYGDGVVQIYVVPPADMPSDSALDAHEVSGDTIRQEQAATTRPDYNILFKADVTQADNTALFQQIALDGQAHEIKGYILSVSCSFHELDCSEMDLREARLSAVRRKLIQEGIDSRRITDEFHDDGTSSVKIFVVRDVNADNRLPSSKNISEAAAGDFLGELLQSLRVTLGPPEYQELSMAFKGCNAVSVLYYPPVMDLGWTNQKGVVRLLIGKLTDSQFQRQLQSIDVRKYLPYACLYGDVGHFPQFQAPPSGLSLKRLADYTTIQRVAPSDFIIDPQIGDTTGQGSHFTDQSWMVSPAGKETASLQIVLADGTHLSVPIITERTWTYPIKKLWTIIVALAGVGIFGGLAKLTGAIKRSPKPTADTSPPSL